METRRSAERLALVRLRFSINAYLEDQGVTQPAEIGKAIGLPAAEAMRLLTRRQYREGDEAALKDVAERLGLTQTASGHWMALADGNVGSALPGGE